MAEQIAWLASALRSSPISQGVVACSPRVEDLELSTEEEGTPMPMVIGSCRISFDFQEAEICDANRGFCWGPLFCNPILVSGYPIPRRPERNTGLEMSINTMSYLIRSQQVVQWGERILMKGYASLLVATLATSSIIVWHLLVSSKSGERISYVDPRLDTLDVRTPKNLSLRMLEGARHIVGWCTSATDFCGKQQHHVLCNFEELTITLCCRACNGLSAGRSIWIKKSALIYCH